MNHSWMAPVHTGSIKFACLITPAQGRWEMHTDKIFFSKKKTKKKTQTQNQKTGTKKEMK